MHAGRAPGTDGGDRRRLLGHGARHSAGACRPSDAFCGAATPAQMRRHAASRAAMSAICPKRRSRTGLDGRPQSCAGALRGARRVDRRALACVPRHAGADRAATCDDDTRIAWATKGFEIASGLLPHQVAGEILGARAGAVLSGPTFAREVGAGLPTAMTVASRDAAFARRWPRCSPDRVFAPTSRPTSWASKWAAR